MGYGEVETQLALTQLCVGSIPTTPGWIIRSNRLSYITLINLLNSKGGKSYGTICD